MISVSISINANAIYARSAVNQSQVNKNGEDTYLVDDGSIIYHRRSKGAVVLAKKLLDTIKEQK